MKICTPAKFQHFGRPDSKIRGSEYDLKIMVCPSCVYSVRARDSVRLEVTSRVTSELLRHSVLFIWII